MGFLDMFDNPNIMSSLLGIDGYNPNSGAAGGMAALVGQGSNPLPQPTAQQLNPPPTQATVMPPTDPRAPVQNPQGDPGVPMMRPPLPPTDPRTAQASVPPPGNPTGANPPINPNSTYQNVAENTGNPYAGAGGPTTPPPPATPTPPPPQQGGVNVPVGPQAQPAAVPSSKFQGIGSALGIPQAMGMSAQDWRSRMAGLGRGLSAVGAQRPGASAGAAFSAGMGGALQGSAAASTQQEQQLFNNQNTAFHDYLAARQQGNNDQVAQARSNYLNHNAQYGATGKNPFSGTPYGQALELEKSLDKDDDRTRKEIALEQNRIKSELQSGLIEPDDAKQQYAKTRQDLADIKTSRNQRRIDAAKQRGVDPNAYLWGTDAKHPFDASKMTPAQIAQLPEGAFFKTADGQLHTRKPYTEQAPYPGWQPPQAPAAPAAPAVNVPATQAAYGSN